MARKMNIWPRTVEETATYKIVQDMPRDYAVYVGSRYVGSRADYFSAYTLAIAETTAATEETLDEAAFEAAELAASAAAISAAALSAQEAAALCSVHAEDAARQAAEDAALAAYNAARAPYMIIFDSVENDYGVFFGVDLVDRALVDRAPTYSDADAIIDAHIARRQADERAAAEWSEIRHHGA